MILVFDALLGGGPLDPVAPQLCIDPTGHDAVAADTVWSYFERDGLGEGP